MPGSAFKGGGSEALGGSGGKEPSGPVSFSPTSRLRAPGRYGRPPARLDRIIRGAYGDAFYRATMEAGLGHACARFRAPSHCMLPAYCRDYAQAYDMMP